MCVCVNVSVCVCDNKRREKERLRGKQRVPTQCVWITKHVDSKACYKKV